MPGELTGRIPVDGSEVPHRRDTVREGVPDLDEVVDLTVVLRRRVDRRDIGATIATLRDTAAADRRHLDIGTLDAEHGAHPDDVDAVLALAGRHALTLVDTAPVAPSVRLRGSLGNAAA